MFPNRTLEELSRTIRRSGDRDHNDFYINFFTVGPITEDTQRVTGMII